MTTAGVSPAGPVWMMETDMPINYTINREEGVDDFQVTSVGIARFVGFDETSRDVIGDHKLAIVAAKDVIFGMARMYQFQTQRFKPNVKIFRDLEQARKWLGLE